MVAGAPDADLLGVGRVCAVPTCGVRDFLPFTCAGCGAVTCVEHRTGPAHACAAPQPGSERVLVCPVCASAVRLPAGADPKDEAVAAAAFDEHVRSKVRRGRGWGGEGGQQVQRREGQRGQLPTALTRPPPPPPPSRQACNPANYARVHKKPTCPVPGCRDRLGPSNTVTCKACALATCLRHRHGSDHGCAARVAAARPPSASAAVKATMARWFGCAGDSGRVGGDAPHVSAREAAAAAAARRLAGHPRGATTTQTRGPPAGGAAAAAPTCPVCARAFASRRDLAAHHAADHPGAPPLTRCVVA
jgi:hypothetical protein